MGTTRCRAERTYSGFGVPWGFTKETEREDKRTMAFASEFWSGLEIGLHLSYPDMKGSAKSAFPGEF